MSETLKPNMLTRLKQKMTHQKIKGKYMIFRGSRENYFRYEWELENSIALFHGKANPVRHLSVVDLNYMNVERLPCYKEVSYNLYQGSLEGRVVLVKKSCRDGSDYFRYEWELEESIALFHGKANPVRHLSVVDLNNMNVERLPCYKEVSYNLYQGSWEGRVVLVKKFCEKFSHFVECYLREIVIATQMATHNNAHKILGYCLETDLPVVVYEWMPPETLEDRIFVDDENQSKAVLEWKDRLRIAWEISQVVAFLHTAFPSPIIHRDLNPGLVFLDQNNAAKLGDFSYSVSIPEGEEFVEDTVTGTVGYVDPEYYLRNRVAESTDVYSFGMLLLVLLTGKRPILFKGSIKEIFRLDYWVQDRIKNDCVNEIVDPAITRNEATSIQDLQLRAFAQLALRCIAFETDDRPTMVEVATELKNMITSPEFIPTPTNFQIKGRRWFSCQIIYKNKMGETPNMLTPNMLTRLKKKMTGASIQSRKNSQHQMGRDKYMVFIGGKENFVRHGAWLLEESIALFHGKANPVRHLSVVDLNNMNVERLPCYKEGSYNLYQGSWEGRVVLVKKFRCDGSHYAECSLREIVIATQMATHNNAHKILGCCLETDLPVLVYEWMPPETLEDRIFVDHENQSKAVLEWKDRLRIAWEISHVVAYLHTAFPRPIIHKDLKPTLVFLDQDNAAKLGDFSLSISIPEGKEFVENVKLSGTFGFIAPEYMANAKVSKSTDVYSFGILLLVLLTGKRPCSFSETNEELLDIVTWVQNSIKNNHVNDIVDPTITRNGVTSIEDLQLRASAQLAMRCVSKEEDCRPTMVEVATEIKNMIRSLEEGGIYRYFLGSKENFMQNEDLVLEESMSLFHGKVDPIRYFSADELNNMNVEFWHNNCNWYQGSWEGRPVLVKLPESVLDAADGLTSSNKILLWLSREIVVATQMSTHNNVHKLLGCCLETKFPVLIYEWVAAATLEDRILLKNKNQSKLPLLEWKDRLRIAWEISHVIAYLHTAFPRPIVHTYLMPTTVFLENNVAKLYNFGNSVSIPEGEEFMKLDFLHGTLGYMPPEFSNDSHVTESIDVYSFGMLFLMLLTAKEVSEETHNSIGLKEWVQEDIKHKCVTEIVDSAITRNGVTAIEELQLTASIHLALSCVVEEAYCRPTMVEVATELMNMITSLDTISSTSIFKGRNIHRIFNGSGENFMQFKSLVLQESFSLFHDPVNPIQYFSVHELNSMNVEHDQILPYSYQGSWDGRAILAKLQNAVTIEIQSSILREIVVATKTATHNNVQKLLGCCLETKIPILVYEWVASETLKDRILPMYESQRKLPPLSWKDRLRIAWEISDVVFYLHTAFPRPIIHGNLELENILLDQNGSVKLSNFNHFISTLKGGEFGKDCRIETIGGLMAPDNFKGCSLAECADVYSFGLLFLVLLTGKDSSFPFTSTREPTSTNLIHWVIKALRMDRISVIIDPAINKNEVTAIELRAPLGLALRCTTSLEGCRPTMADVATELKCMICSHDSISCAINFQRKDMYRIFRGSKEYFMENGALVLEEITSQLMSLTT